MLRLAHAWLALVLLGGCDRVEEKSPPVRTRAGTTSASGAPSSAASPPESSNRTALAVCVANGLLGAVSPDHALRTIIKELPLLPRGVALPFAGTLRQVLGAASADIRLGVLPRLAEALRRLGAEQEARATVLEAFGALGARTGSKAPDLRDLVETLAALGLDTEAHQAVVADAKAEDALTLGIARVKGGDSLRVEVERQAAGDKWLRERALRAAIGSPTGESVARKLLAENVARADKEPPSHKAEKWDLLLGTADGYEELGDAPSAESLRKRVQEDAGIHTFQRSIAVLMRARALMRAGKLAEARALLEPETPADLSIVGGRVIEAELLVREGRMTDAVDLIYKQETLVVPASYAMIYLVSEARFASDGSARDPAFERLLRERACH